MFLIYLLCLFMLQSSLMASECEAEVGVQKALSNKAILHLLPPALWKIIEGYVQNGYEPHPVDSDCAQRILSIAYSPDGGCIAYASFDRKICIKQGEESSIVYFIGSPAHVIAFNPDGAKFLAAGMYCEGKVVLYQAENKGPVEPSNVIYQAQGRVDHIEFNPHDEQKLAIIRSVDQAVEIIDVASNQCVQRYAHGSDCMQTAAFHPEGKSLVSAGSGMMVYCWDANSKKLIGKLSGHRGTILTAAYGPNGYQLTTAGSDHRVLLWDARMMKLLFTLSGHKERIGKVAFNCDGDVVSASYDRTMRIWDAKTADEKQTTTFGTTVYAMACNPGKREIAAADGNRLRIYRMEPLGLCNYLKS